MQIGTVGQGSGQVARPRITQSCKFIYKIKTHNFLIIEKIQHQDRRLEFRNIDLGDF